MSLSPPRESPSSRPLRDRGELLAIGAVREAADSAGPARGADPLDDFRRHLGFLATALELDRPEVFAHYLRWNRNLLEHRGISVERLLEEIRSLDRACAATLRSDELESVRKLLAPAVATPPVVEEPSAPVLSESARAYLDRLLEGRHREAIDDVLAEASAGRSLLSIYDGIITPTMHEVGRLWQLNRIGVAEEHYCSAATEALLVRLHAASPLATPRARTVLVACPDGNRHELGARMLADLLEQRGFTTRFVGASTPTTDLVRMAEGLRPNVIALSVSMFDQASAVRALVRALHEAGTGARPRVVLGGLAVGAAPDLWSDLGADVLPSGLGEALETVTRAAG